MHHPHAHLDKCFHITVHTYPEYHPDHFDLNLPRRYWCREHSGKISLLNALNYLISSFESDIITIWLCCGVLPAASRCKKCFIDREIKSIQDFIADDILKAYEAFDVNFYPNNTFHTKMLIKDIDSAELPVQPGMWTIFLLNSRKDYQKAWQRDDGDYQGMNIYWSLLNNMEGETWNSGLPNSTQKDTIFSIRVTSRLVSAQSEFQKIEVYESRDFGRILVLDVI